MTVLLILWEIYFLTTLTVLIIDTLSKDLKSRDLNQGINNNGYKQDFLFKLCEINPDFYH